MLDQFWEDLEWTEVHHSELLNKYREKWIAVHNKNIIASGKRGERVERNAKAKVDGKEILMYYVDSGSNIYAG